MKSVDWLPDRAGWWLLGCSLLAHAVLLGGLATARSAADRITVAPVLQGVLVGPDTTPPSPLPMGAEEKPKPRPPAKPRLHRNPPSETRSPVTLAPALAADPPIAQTRATVPAPETSATSIATASPSRDPEVAPASSAGESAGRAASAPVAQGTPSPAQEAIAPPRTDAAHLANPRPKYPSESRRRLEQGTVVLDVHILPDGSVAEVRVKHSSGHSLLDRAAADAVRLWRYVPARRGDTPIAFWYEQPIVFALQR